MSLKTTGIIRLRAPKLGTKQLIGPKQWSPLTWLAFAISMIRRNLSNGAVAQAPPT